MGLLHTYWADVVWTGAGDTGTSSYTAYSRDHEVHLGDKPPLPGSSDPAFRGDPSRYNPEELLVSALGQCHMLWFLHMASAEGVVVIGYTDRATGTMRVSGRGHGQFTEVTLRPRVRLATPDEVSDEQVRELHERAHQMCFISRSVNFPVHIDPVPIGAQPQDGRPDDERLGHPVPAANAGPRPTRAVPLDPAGEPV